MRFIQERVLLNVRFFVERLAGKFVSTANRRASFDRRSASRLFGAQRLQNVQMQHLTTGRTDEIRAEISQKRRHDSKSAQSLFSFSLCINSLPLLRIIARSSKVRWRSERVAPILSARITWIGAAGATCRAGGCGGAREQGGNGSVTHVRWRRAADVKTVRRDSRSSTVTKAACGCLGYGIAQWWANGACRGAVVVGGDAGNVTVRSARQGRRRKENKCSRARPSQQQQQQQQPTAIVGTVRNMAAARRNVQRQ